MKDFFLSWGLIIVAAFFNSYASFVVKLRFNQLGKIEISSLGKTVRYLFTFLKSPIVLSAVVTFILSPLFWFAALNKIDLSVAIPVQFSLHLLLALTFSSFFLKENVDIKKIAGVICLAVSLFFLYKS